MTTKPVPETDSEAGGACLDADFLRRIFRDGPLDLGDPARVLEQFAGSAGPGWPHLETVAADRSLHLDLDAMTRQAGESPGRAPIALVLARIATLVREPASAASLRSVHRYLLQAVRRGTAFELRWLLVEEARHLALQSPPRRLERWSPIAALLDESSGGPVKRRCDLALLVEAYRADDMRVADGRRAMPEAARLLDEALKQSAAAHAAIQASIFEVRADYHRHLLQPLQALAYLEAAEALWRREAEIPGRLAETRARVALTNLLLDNVGTAFTTFHEALDLIPGDTDPRLRLDILYHLAELTIRRGDHEAGRGYLDELEPLFETYASQRMRAQIHRLRGLVALPALETLERH